MRRIGVVFDEGGVGVREILHSISPTADVVFLTSHSPANRTLMPMLRRIGEVVELTADREGNIALARRARLDAIVTFCDHLLPLTADLAHSCDLLYHSPATAALLTDKYLQRATLARDGVDTVASLRVATLSDGLAAVQSVGVPAVLKPRVGMASRETHLIDTMTAAASVISETLNRCPQEEFVLEEFVRGCPSAPFGDYVSVESAVVGGKIQHLAVTGKTPLVMPFRETGQFWPANLDAQLDRGVQDLVTQALDSLGVRTGLTHTEIKLTDRGPKIIEVNGRLGGLLSELYLRAGDLDLVQLASAIALGSSVSPGRRWIDGVAFQYNNLAPRFACRLDSVEGADLVSAHPAVRRYFTHVGRGTELPGGVGTTTLDLICGQAESYEAMFRVIDELLPRMRFTFSTGEAIIQLTGADLAI
jgi:biotin carboxylase